MPSLYDKLLEKHLKFNFFLKTISVGNLIGVLYQTGWTNYTCKRSTKIKRLQNMHLICIEIMFLIYGFTISLKMKKIYFLKKKHYYSKNWMLISVFIDF